MNLQSQILTAINKISSLPQFRSSGTRGMMTLEKLVYPDISGFTPLHYVSAADDYDLAQDLVFIFRQLGQPQFLSILAQQGRTPVHWAVASGSVRMVKLLTENGAPLNAQDYDGAAPIHNAIMAINKFRDTEKLDEGREVLNYLASRADINQSDIEGVSALHLAAELGDIESIRVLLENGAWVNFKDHQGENALFYAVRGEQNEVIKALVEEYNIDMELLNEDDENILDLCKSIGDISLMEMVTSLYNARVNNNKGCLLNETNGIKCSGQNKVELMASHSGSIRFSGHSCA
jgi:ankyrin repeat protein